MADGVRTKPPVHAGTDPLGRGAPTVAALYVMQDGPYYGLDGVEPWGLPDRDARDYAGPWPVVAHPPCKRWGRYWSGGPSAKVKRKLGDDDGCFSAALFAVRRWGGVIEHPEASHAWRCFGIIRPPRGGGWVAAGDGIGWTCCVEQGHYGHRARKATWLYAAHVAVLPSLLWGRSAATVRLDSGFHTTEERRSSAREKRERMSGKELEATPLIFRDLLIGIARSVGAREASGNTERKTPCQP